MIDTREQRQPGAGNRLWFRIANEDAGNLRHGLNDEHAGHHSIMRKMPLKERLIEADVLDPDGVLVRLNFPDAIHQNERVPMRQQRQNIFRSQ